MELRQEEEWARQMVAAALGVPVEEHDDNSQPQMYDLRIRYTDRPVAAVEVTAAADSESIQLWKLVNGGDERWLVEGLAGGWMVFLRPAARARRVLSELPSLLGELEANEIRRLDVNDFDQNELVRRASALDIASASQGGTDYPGSVYLTIELPSERSGGVVSDSGNPVAEWVGRFLREPGNADVLCKLKASGADERHAFVLLPGFTTAPFVVADTLMRPCAPIPSEPPDLPDEVTHVWIVSTWTTGRGLRWAPIDGWSAFDKSGQSEAA